MAKPLIEAGQIWTYRDAEEPTSRVIVGVLDDAGQPGVPFPMAMIAVTNVWLIDMKTGEPVLTELGSAPIALDRLERSVLECEGVIDVSEDLIEGYRDWRTAYDAEDAGVFTLTVAEVVSASREILEANLER